jgi:5-methyltetrahydropteroyltriglutamate--homocysteine methyltransferase
VTDLEAASTSVIQVDEPTLRETLPLRAADRPAYLAWATEAFRPTTGGFRPDTQIHTRMCYAEFGDIVQAIDDLDADVTSLEAARSHMQVAHELVSHGAPREADPGMYDDTHSPRVPSAEEAAGTAPPGAARSARSSAGGLPGNPFTNLALPRWSEWVRPG